ncbi:IclR family transcriptional regulator [Streptomyces jeddahensis]|uniref:Acetate operon repressor n=1 Tax=Streptomyces jeddahensis TaxID=1716141 RepID=A0A177HTN5_9ACTN|nr:IclR family transcriptional regulator [Streptomyces jeddahensis]OAH13949.1 acetate operon repressor [Streptomyces jeddahensis]
MSDAAPGPPSDPRPPALTGPLDRALAVLRHMAGAHGATATEIAEVAGTSRSTAYRLAERLTAWGFLALADEPGRWEIGPEALRLGLSVLSRSQVAQAAPELVRHLMELTRETCGVAIPLRDTMVFVHRELGPMPSPATTQLGTTRPIHCTAVGKAWLSGLSEPQLADVLGRLWLRAHTPNTITTVSALERELDLTRRRGWAVDDGELSRSTGSCAAVVFGPDGQPAAAVSVWGPRARIVQRMGRIGPVVASTADALTVRLRRPAQPEHHPMAAEAEAGARDRHVAGG